MNNDDLQFLAPLPARFTVRQLATRWSVHVATVRRYIRDGSLMATRHRKSYSVTLLEVARFERESLGF